MIRHVFRLVWNRKRSTGLILIELMICFLVLCGILAAAIHLAYRWSRPLGFDYHDVWSVEISGMRLGASGEELAADRRALSDMLRAIRDMPGVEAVALSTNTPFSGSTWGDETRIGNKDVGFLWTVVSQDLPAVLGLRLLHGRWFDDTDEALGYTPVVLTRGFARELFGMDDPVGRAMPVHDESGRPAEKEDDAEIRRVVGIVDDYRRMGMTAGTPYCMFVAVRLTDGPFLPQELLVRVRPGTTAAFEEKLVRTMQTIAPRWSYDTTPLESRRRSAILEVVLPLVLATVVAVFLIVMVGLGLVGVLWLNVTRRTAELGLRRAMGATGVSVRRQVVAELWALTAIAVIVGAVVFLQLPVLGVDFGLPWPVFPGAVILAALALYAFVTFCGLYPAWLATRVQPAAALQYE